MHRRLHAGASRLRQLPKLCADAQSSLAHASDVSCPSCTEANATHLSHQGSRYQPSYLPRQSHTRNTAIRWAHSFARAVDITTHSSWSTTTLASSSYYHSHVNATHLPSCASSWLVSTDARD
eukprot:5777148-Prymnesium_polylepis.1